jgi:hypothetical protein
LVPTQAKVNLPLSNKFKITHQDIRHFAQGMKKLVLIQSGHASTFDHVNAPVQNKFSDGHKNRTGHDPDGTSVNEAMGSHADDPYLRGAGWIFELFEETPVFPFGQELSLQWEVTKCMTDEKS